MASARGFPGFSSAGFQGHLRLLLLRKLVFSLLKLGPEGGNIQLSCRIESNSTIKFGRSWREQTLLSGQLSRYWVNVSNIFDIFFR